MWEMICTKITTTAVGMPTSILVWGGDIPTIHGTTHGLIPGITVAGTIPGFTAIMAGMGGEVPGTTADGIHPGTMGVGMILGIMVIADIITDSMMAITAA